ncbi:hypothetical protein [Microseira wollei]|nr:hypothetical protein [Microseira wollei]
MPCPYSMVEAIRLLQRLPSRRIFLLGSTSSRNYWELTCLSG